jgi:alkylation response protein AidB-like acyl-CoA dehydrogenase
MIADQFAYCRIPPEAEALRAEVRGFLREALAGRAPVHVVDSWMRFDAEFSRKLVARGWIGMALPRRDGDSGGG